MPNNRIVGDRVRYAVVGAGWFGQAAVLPAFANARENSKLAAIVSGDVEKRAVLSADYGVPAHPLDSYRTLLASGEIDAVYLVSPNSAHREQAIAAAEHGVHVLCEKPLADTALAAEAMTTACDRAGVRLMTAYRLHFEPTHLKAIELLNEGAIGEPRLFSATFTQQVEPNNARLSASLGGHPLTDVGIYCVNAARYLFRAEPIEVTAFEGRGNDPRFNEVPEMVSAILRFPNDRLASFTCGFGSSKSSTLHVIGTMGDLRLDPAFTHVGERKMIVTRDGKSRETTFPESDQIGPEIVYFSDCVQHNRRPEPDGREGVIDLWILEAIKASCRKGMAVPLQPVAAKPRPNANLEKTKPARKEPDLVNAAAP